MRRRITDSILDEIRGMIIKGELRVGDKLPNQNDLALQLGVSRPSLREALHTLALLGVIEQRPGAGTIVKARTPAFLAGGFDLPLISDLQGVNELIETRRVLEVYIVEMAVERASESELNKLERILKQMTSLAEKGQVEKYSNQDMCFHYIIAKAAHNRFLSHLFNAIQEFLDQFIRESFTIVPEILRESQQGHIGIFNAIKARNRKQAAKEMISHIELGRITMKRLYEDSGNGNAL